MHHHLCILIQQLKGNLGNLTRFFSTSVWMQMWEWMQRMNPNRTQVQYEARNTTQESRFSARSLLAWINGNQQAGSSLHISEASGRWYIYFFLLLKSIDRSLQKNLHYFSSSIQVHRNIPKSNTFLGLQSLSIYQKQVAGDENFPAKTKV